MGKEVGRAARIFLEMGRNSQWENRTMANN